MTPESFYVPAALAGIVAFYQVAIKPHRDKLPERWRWIALPVPLGLICAGGLFGFALTMDLIDGAL